MKTKLLLLLLAGASGVATAATLQLGSSSSRASISGSSGSFAPLFSADGRFVVFVSQARNLVTNDDVSPFLQAYRRDVMTGTTLLVSVSNNGVGGANDSACAPAISADVFLRDLQNNTLERLVPTNRPPGPVVCLRPAVSEDGRHVAWLEQPARIASTEATLAITNIAWLDRQTGESQYIPASSEMFGTPSRSGPVLSRDGRTLVFTLGQQVYLRRMDVPASTNQLISVNLSGNPGARESGNPQITPDGQWVVFSSLDSNLTSNASPTGYMIYDRDLTHNMTRLITASTTGGQTIINPAMR